ncbi:MAG: GNAT family protein, partial [Oscillospiraceae bacterium]
AFKELNLEKVYLNVLCDNTRAVSFYKKAGAVYEGTFAKHIKIKGQRKDLAWYCWFKEDNR